MNVFLWISQRWRKVSESFSIARMHGNSWQWLKLSCRNTIRKVCLLDVDQHCALFTSIPVRFLRMMPLPPLIAVFTATAWSAALSDPRCLQCSERQIDASLLGCKIFDSMHGHHVQSSGLAWRCSQLSSSGRKFARAVTGQEDVSAVEVGEKLKVAS